MELSSVRAAAPHRTREWNERRSLVQLMEIALAHKRKKEVQIDVCRLGVLEHDLNKSRYDDGVTKSNDG